MTVEGFPKFFTPNGDTVNDFWQFIQPIEGETIVLTSIQIFDRYGKLLKTIQQNFIHRTYIGVAKIASNLIYLVFSVAGSKDIRVAAIAAF